MKLTYVPGPLDDALLIENAIAKTASFAGTTFDNGASFAPGGAGLPVLVVVDATTFALGGTAGASTWTGVLQESDNGTDWTIIGPTITISSTGVISIPGILSSRYSRLNLNLAGATGTGTLGLSAWQTPMGFAD
jgi:hypothetical protein